MTEIEIRNKVINTAKKYFGIKEGSAEHKEILRVYNNHKPLARGWVVQANDAWCATFVSAIGIMCGYTDIMPTECGCGQMIQLYSKIGRWIERDNYVPKVADIIMYDWDDTKGSQTDCTGWPEHVGFVAAVSGSTLTIIEGNRYNSVAYRTLNVNGQSIRGYCIPDYASKATRVTSGSSAEPKPMNTVSVFNWQVAAIADGYAFPKYGADGAWGAECESVAKKAIVKKRLVYTNKSLTRIVQKAVGVTADGLCGKDTDAAIRAYQKKHGLDVDGCVGLNTWKKILNIK